LLHDFLNSVLYPTECVRLKELLCADGFSAPTALCLGRGGGSALTARSLGRGGSSAAAGTRPTTGGVGKGAATAPSSIDGSSVGGFPSIDGFSFPHSPSQAWFDAADSDPSSPVSW